MLALADIVSRQRGRSAILTRADRVGDRSGNATGPLFIIDIAVPRDVDPSAGEIEQVFLYNVDDCKATVRGEPRERGRSESARAEAIVAEELRGSRRGFALAGPFRRWSPSPAIRDDPALGVAAARVRSFVAVADARTASTKSPG